MKNSSNIRELYFTYATSAYDFKKQTLKEIIFGNAVTNFIQINFYMKVCFSKIFTTSIAYFRTAEHIFFYQGMRAWQGMRAVWPKMACFNKFWAIRRWNPSKNHANLKFLD